MWPGGMSSHRQCGLEPIVADRIQLVGNAASTVEDEMTEAPALPLLGRLLIDVSKRSGRLLGQLQGLSPTVDRFHVCFSCTATEV